MPPIGGTLVTMLKALDAHAIGMTNQNVQNFHDRLPPVAPTTGALREVWGE
jgi:hypothetical protein